MMTDRIIKIADTIGRAYGSFLKARDDMLRKPRFVADMIQRSAWQGGMFDNTDEATLRAIRNSWVFSDIQMKALDLAMSKGNVYINPSGIDGEGQLAPGHDFLKVLRRPNPYMGTSLLWQYTHWWMDLRGKTFWFLAPGQDGKLAEIWPLPANKMAIEPTDDNHGIKRWILKLTTWWYLDPKYVCYFRYANPFDFFDGLPPLVAAMLTIDTDLAMKTWNGAFFGQDNVMPSAIISLGSGDANRLIDPADIQAVKEELKSEYQAINRKTVVTNANNMSAALLGWNAKDMDFLAGMGWNRDEIDWCFGVPPGMHDKNSTEANAKVGRAIFKDNMWGLKSLYADEISNQILKPFYSDDLEFRFEDDRVVDRELQLREAELAKEAMSREEWAQKYFGVELQPDSVTMAEGIKNSVIEQEQWQFGDEEPTPDTVSTKSFMKGGEGSGNFGHAGHPGKVGGSAKGDATDIDNRNLTDYKIERIDATRSAGAELNVEWKRTFGKSHNENEGPFWDVEGEKSPRYYVVRDSEGKLVAGATTVQQGLRTNILSIASHSKGAGKQILEQIKSKNQWVVALASTDESKAWFESQGFVEDIREGQWNRKWTRKSMSDELDIFYRKAVNKFKEKKHCKNLKFVSDVLDDETVKAIQSDLEGVEQRSDIDEIFAHWKGAVKHMGH